MGRQGAIGCAKLRASDLSWIQGKGRTSHEGRSSPSSSSTAATGMMAYATWIKLQCKKAMGNLYGIGKQSCQGMASRASKRWPTTGDEEEIDLAYCLFSIFDVSAQRIRCFTSQVKNVAVIFCGILFCRNHSDLLMFQWSKTNV